MPAANWMIQNVGTICDLPARCLVPVAPGVLAPSGVALVGVALVLRDLVQTSLGARAVIIAILLGTIISALLAPARLTLASASAFLLSEFVDFSVFSAIAKRKFVAAVVASSCAGILCDSAVFLLLAFGNLDYFPGQTIGKLWGLVLALPLVALRRRLRSAPT